MELLEPLLSDVSSIDSLWSCPQGCFGLYYHPEGSLTGLKFIRHKESGCWPFSVATSPERLEENSSWDLARREAMIIFDGMTKLPRNTPVCEGYRAVRFRDGLWYSAIQVEHIAGYLLQNHSYDPYYNPWKNFVLHCEEKFAEAIGQIDGHAGNIMITSCLGRITGWKLIDFSPNRNVGPYGLC